MSKKSHEENAAVGCVMGTLTTLGIMCLGVVFAYRSDNPPRAIVVVFGCVAFVCFAILPVSLLCASLATKIGKRDD